MEDSPMAERSTHAASFDTAMEKLQTQLIGTAELH
jgi:hypothetical protein